MRLDSVRYCVVAFLASTLLCGRCSADGLTIQFVSDATWSAYSVNPDGSRGALLGPSQCICNPRGGCPCCWTGNVTPIPGACWLWRPGTTPSTVPVDLERMIATLTLDVPGLPSTGTFYLAADDFAELRVNGYSVGSIGSVSDYGSAASAQAGLTRFDIQPFLVPGRNEIEIHVQNGPGWFTGTSCNPCTFGQNPTGVLAGGAIDYSPATPLARRSWGQLKTIYR